MRILVTGHNGYIGSAMTPILMNAGHQVLGFDSFFFEECSFGSEPIAVPSVRKDIRDVSEGDLSGFDGVVHLAALCNDPLGNLNPEWTDAINHVASVRLARLAREGGVERFLFSSSCSMYGASASDGLVTEEAPLRPLTPYATAKVRAEEEIATLADRDFSPVFLRNATVYGVSARLRADVVLNNLVAWACTTGQVRVLSDGSPWRPLVHVEDVARVFLAALEAPRPAIHNQAFNVGSNAENYQVRELAEIVRSVVPGCAVAYSPRPSPDPRSYRVDFDKLARALPGVAGRHNARLGAKELAGAFQGAGLRVEDVEGPRFTRLAQVKRLLAAGALDGSLRWRR